LPAESSDLRITLQMPGVPAFQVGWGKVVNHDRLNPIQVLSGFTFFINVS